MGGSSARKRKEAEGVKQDRRALLLYEPNLYKAALLPGRIGEGAGLIVNK